MVSEATATVLGHDKDINALTVSPNDALLASASQVSDRSRRMTGLRVMRMEG